MVDRCVCSERKFSDLKKIIESEKVNNVDGLRRHVNFGINCRLCLPYVSLIFTTGKTEFEPIPLPGEENE
jgi:hypothetical protein